MQKSKFFNLNVRDWIKGALTAAIVAVLTALTTFTDGGILPTLAELKTIGGMALTAFIGYILKNGLTNSKDQFLKKEPTNPPA